ncbi:hypothetical protein R6Q59_022946 [Mikania micrantha]
MITKASTLEWRPLWTRTALLTVNREWPPLWNSTPLLRRIPSQHSCFWHRRDAFDLSLRDTFKKQESILKPTTGFSLFDTCFDLSSRTRVTVPTVSFNFVGGERVAAVEGRRWRACCGGGAAGVKGLRWWWSGR